MNDKNLEYRILKLEEEVSSLKVLLERNGIRLPKASNVEVDKKANSANGGNDAKNNHRIKHEEITCDLVKLFFSYFTARKDVFAKRSGKANPKTGKFGYFTQCQNFWKSGICPRQAGESIKCYECPGQDYTPISITALTQHLQGNKENCSDVIGVYPLLEDNTCRFFVYDFDEHDVDSDISQLENIIKEIYAIMTSMKIPFLLERSRSGRGFHIWMFFTEYIQASIARKFAELLLMNIQDSVSLSNFKFFDRIIPAQDELLINRITKKRGLGNLVALPLQGQAINNRNTVFVNEDLIPFYDQWETLKNTQRISPQFIQESIEQWSYLESALLSSGADIDNSKFSNKQKYNTTKFAEPWEDNDDSHSSYNKNDAKVPIELILSNMLYINQKGMSIRLQNAIRRLAAFGNPQFFKNKKLGLSNYSTSRIIYCGYDEDGYICLPRGLLDEVVDLLKTNKLEFRQKDKTNVGKTINVDFIGKLYPEQEQALNSISSYNNGVIAATTAFGKTVVGAKIIAERKVNTLVIVHTREIMENWINDLTKFLDINEDFPTYKTKGGHTRKRKTLIGKLYSTHNSITNIIDVVMYSSLGKGADIKPLVKQYGMLIMDECHHGAAQTVEDVIGACNAKYVYGLTATPKRDDGLEKKIFFQFGPIRYRYTAKQRAAKMGIGHFVYPRFTSFVCEGKIPINDVYKSLVENKIRNQLIVDDVIKCIKKGRNPIIITQFRDHADELFSLLKDKADEVLLMYGGSKKSRKDEIRQKLLDMPASSSVVLVATGKYIGEGFNFPRLDTLMLATPIAWRGNVEQYAGRLHRDYETKKDTIIYDYVDNKVDVLQRMYYKRMRAYKSIGYLICDGVHTDITTTSIFYAPDNYFDDFTRDLESATKSIYISCPWINAEKIAKFKDCILKLFDFPVRIILETCDPVSYPDSMISRTKRLIESLKGIGVYVNTHKKLFQNFCIIDDKIVWYGKVNFLSRPKEDDIIMRVVDEKIAFELKVFVTDRIISYVQCDVNNHFFDKKRPIQSS